MKRNSLLFIFTLAIFSFSQAQNVPNQFNYQAVARDATGNLLSGKTIGVRIVLNDGATSYTETHTATTNAYGLFTLTIGGGAGFGNLAWAAGNVTINIAIDPAGGTSYTPIGSAKLLSVPYALFAGNGGTGGSGTVYANGGGIRLQGNKFLANVDKTSIDTVGGQLSLIGVKGSLIDSVVPGKIGKANALTGQVLKWNGSAWTPQPDDTGAAGTGIKTINTLNGADQVLATGSIGTDFTIASAGFTHTFNIPSASAIARGLLTPTDWNNFNNKVGLTAPVAGDMVYFDGTTWKSIGIGTFGQVMSIDPQGFPVWSTTSIGGLYTSGKGISIVGTVISNTGDTDSTNDVTIGSTAGGDLEGTYPNPTIKPGVLDLTNFSTIGVSAGQVIKFDGSKWIYDMDQTVGSSSASQYKIDNVTIDTTSLGQLQVKQIDSTHIIGIGLEDLPFHNAQSGQTFVYTGTGWTIGNVGATGTSPWLINGANIYYNTGKVGIGKTTPAYKLDVAGTIHSDSIQTNVVLTDTLGAYRSKINRLLITDRLVFPLGAADGYVLTSGPLGNATWKQLPPTTGGYTAIGGIGITPSNKVKVNVDKLTIDTTTLAGNIYVSLVKKGVDTSYVKPGKSNTILSTNAAGIVTWLDKNSLSGTVTGVGNILVKQNTVSTKPVLDSIQQIKSIPSMTLAFFQGTNQFLSASPSGALNIASDLFTVDDRSGNPGIRFTAKNVGIGLIGDPKSRLHVGGGVRIDSLAGTGVRMVVANAQGYLSTQIISSSSLLQGSDIRIANGRINLDRTLDSTVAITIPAGKNFRINGIGSQRVLIDSSNVGVKLGVGVGTALSKVHTSGSLRSDSLKGTGTRILVARTNGVIDTLNNKTGVLTYNGTTLSWSASSSGLPSGLANQTLRYNGTLAKWDTSSNLSNNGTMVTIGRLSQTGTNVLTVNGRIRTDNITESSDVRYKKDIATLSEALSKVSQLRGVSYYWKSDSLQSKKDIGVIAQELEKVYPELVDTDANGYKSVRYSHLVPVLIEAIKEQQSQIASLKRELTESDTKAQSQEKRIQSMENSLQTMNSQIQLLLELAGKTEGVKASK